MIVSLWTACYVAACAALGGGAIIPPDESPPTRTDVVEVRHFSFEEQEDRDYDLQPDGWSRRRGPGFPQFVRAAIDRAIGFHGRQSLHFALNGGQAAYYSPLVPIDADHEFLLRGRVRSRGLRRDAALVSVSLLDHRRERIERLLCRPVQGDRDWTLIEIGPFRPTVGARFLVLGCHLASHQGTDVHGDVWFDDLWLGRLPVLDLALEPARRYFVPQEPISIEARVLGLSAPKEHRLTLRVESPDGDALAEHDVPLDVDEAQGAEVVRPFRTSPPDRQHGFYRVRAVLTRQSRIVLERELTYAVRDPIEQVGHGEFGWSLTAGWDALPPEMLVDLARDAGVNRLKLPLWSTPFAKTDGESRTADLTRLVDELDRQQIFTIGVLSDPPEALQEKFAQRVPDAAAVFTMPRDFWGPYLEHLVARYSFRIRDWQLGADGDASFSALTVLAPAVEADSPEKGHLGAPTRVGLPWSPQTPLPLAKLLPRGFVTWNIPATDSPAQIQQLLSSTTGGGLERWTSLALSSPGERKASERAADLALRMLAAKLGRSEGIFASNPFTESGGLVSTSGAPTELFLPWRTMALALRGATHLGQFVLPQGSRNEVFIRNREVIVVLWHDRPVEELFYFGDDATCLDLWGRPQRMPLEEETGEQGVQVGAVPRVIRGGSEPVARWRLGLKFEKGRIPSEFGKHPDALLGTNTFSRPINGRATLRFPEGWELENDSWPLRLAPGEAFRLPTQIRFPSGASVGGVRAAVDFEIFAEQAYRFTVEIPYRLGLGDVDLHVNTRRTPEGRLEIEQVLTNRTDPPETLDFECHLFIPGRVRQKHIVTGLGPGEDRKVFTLPGAKSLEGSELWLRVEQVDGSRVLNYHWTVDSRKMPQSNDEENE